LRHLATGLVTVTESIRTTIVVVRLIQKPGSRFLAKEQIAIDLGSLNKVTNRFGIGFDAVHFE
jgi:hypothetical protein